MTDIQALESLCALAQKWPRLRSATLQSGDWFVAAEFHEPAPAAAPLRGPTSPTPQRPLSRREIVAEMRRKEAGLASDIEPDDEDDE